MIEIGNVVKTLTNNHYLVKIVKNSQCGSCKGCMLGSDDAPQDITLKGYSRESLAVTDSVSIEIKDGSILSAALWIYLYPLLLFIGGTFLGTLFLSDSQSVLIGLVLLITGLYFSGFRNKKAENIVYAIKKI